MISVSRTSNYCLIPTRVLCSSLIIFATLPALAVDTAIFADNQQDNYERCLMAAESDPQAGLDMARRWQGLNGGEPAEHCFGAALLHLGDYEEAARRLQLLAETSDAAPSVRAGLWSQAGRALVEVGNCTEAIAAFDTALSLNISLQDALMDRAICHGLMRDWWSAIDDLNTFIDRMPNSYEALTMRASAYRRLNILGLAVDDVGRAIAINPDYEDALLEQGLLAEARGDADAAHQAWRAILERAPNSPAADAVRRKLEATASATDQIEPN